MPGIRKDLADILEENPIVVMFKAGCPYCTDVFKFIDEKGHVPEKINVATPGGEALRKAAMEVLKIKTVPVVFIKGRFVGGCDKTTSEGVFDKFMAQAPSTREEIHKMLNVQ
jgi:glutaredoxin